ncbi:MAG TPA: SIMPL domain-containing protein, partial [Vicinamibacterales bacterium]|nr:SIMPL domain-containing protein [Vicinamibacterales bacterium]
MKCIASALFVLSLCRPALAQAPPIVSPLQPTIVTRGHAIVNARPDRAFVTIAAESRSRNSADAQKQNAAAMTAVLQKIEQAGVSKDAIRTIGYELQPEFDYVNGRQTFRSYVARNTVEVRLDDIDRVGIVIDAAGSGGATTITGVRFDVRNRAALERDALRQAVADARARADAAAAGA